MAKGRKSKAEKYASNPQQGCGSGRMIGGLFPCCTIIRDDCEENLWMLPPGCVDLVITDPPYGMNYESGQLQWERIVGDNRFPVETLHFLINTPRLASYIFCRWDNLCESVATPRDPEGAFLLPKPESVITWVKPGGGAGDLDHSHSRATESILFYPHLPDHKFKKRPPDVVEAARSGNKSHPTEKPLDLIMKIMGWYDFETVLDPYMGSGTTAQAAKALGKHFLGFEIDDKHHKKSIDLLEGPQLF